MMMGVIRVADGAVAVAAAVAAAAAELILRMAMKPLEVMKQRRSFGQQKQQRRLLQGREKQRKRG